MKRYREIFLWRDTGRNSNMYFSMYNSTYWLAFGYYFPTDLTQSMNYLTLKHLLHNISAVSVDYGWTLLFILNEFRSCFSSYKTTTKPTFLYDPTSSVFVSFPNGLFKINNLRLNYYWYTIYKLTKDNYIWK